MPITWQGKPTISCCCLDWMHPARSNRSGDEPERYDQNHVPDIGHWGSTRYLIVEWAWGQKIVCRRLNVVSGRRKCSSSSHCETLNLIPPWRNDLRARPSFISKGHLASGFYPLLRASRVLSRTDQRACGRAVQGRLALCTLDCMFVKLHARFNSNAEHGVAVVGTFVRPNK